MNVAFRPQTFWCRIRHTLHETANLLAGPFNLSRCEFDYENVFEWFEAKDVEGHSWNVSRKHNGDGEPSFDDYLIIKLTPVPTDTEEIGQKLSNALSCSVYFGEGWYDKDDSWKYVEQRGFTPS